MTQMAVLRRAGQAGVVLCVVAMLAPACQRAVSRPSANAAKAEAFHQSDPKIIGATGRPQLLEFFGLT